MQSPVLFEQRDAVGVVTLNRPERKNALSPQLLEELRAIVSAPAAGVRALVLTGAGDVFCAGGDLGPSASEGMLAQHQGRRLFASTLGAMLRGPVPVVAAVNGDALGGGFGLVAAAHLVVVDERAHFATPELKLGLFPWMIAPVLNRNLPRKVVMDLVLTGRRLAAPEAHGLGFANRLSPPGEALDQALELARQVAAWSPAVVAMGLEALALVDGMDVERAMAHMHSQLSVNLMLDDASEGISAFLARRPPQWKGR